MKTLPRLRIAVRAREPERAAPVRLIGKLVGESLHDGEVRPVPRERRESRWQRVIRAGDFGIGHPRLLRHAPAESEKNRALRSFCVRSRGGRKAAEAERFQRRQRDDRARCTEKVTARESAGFHRKVDSFRAVALAMV